MDGTFKIAQFTDLHWGNLDEEDIRSRGLMDMILQIEQPDFVVFTGDLIVDSKNPEESFSSQLKW